MDLGCLSRAAAKIKKRGLSGETPALETKRRADLQEAKPGGSERAHEAPSLPGTPPVVLLAKGKLVHACLQIAPKSANRAERQLRDVARKTFLNNWALLQLRSRGKRGLGGQLQTLPTLPFDQLPPFSYSGSVPGRPAAPRSTLSGKSAVTAQPLSAALAAWRPCQSLLFLPRMRVRAGPH